MVELSGLNSAIRILVLLQWLIAKFLALYLNNVQLRFPSNSCCLSVWYCSNYSFICMYLHIFPRLFYFQNLSLCLICLCKYHIAGILSFVVVVLFFCVFTNKTWIDFHDFGLGFVYVLLFTFSTPPPTPFWMEDIFASFM